MYCLKVLGRMCPSCCFLVSLCRHGIINVWLSWAQVCLPQRCVAVIMPVTYAWAVMSRTLTDERNFLRDEWTQRRSVGTLSKCRRTGKVTRSDLLRVGKRDECIVSLVMEKRSRMVSGFCHSWSSASVTMPRYDTLADRTSVLIQLDVQITAFTTLRLPIQFRNWAIE